MRKKELEILKVNFEDAILKLRGNLEAIEKEFDKIKILNHEREEYIESIEEYLSTLAKKRKI